MVWLRTRRSLVCTACGAQATTDAVWCGGCGARVTAAGDASPDAATTSTGAWSREVEDDDGDGSDDAGDSDAAAPAAAGRRWAAAAVVVALLAAAGVVATRDAPGIATLGALDAPAGASSTAPPPRDLRVAWAHEFDGSPAGGGVSPGFGRVTVVADDQRVRVDATVVTRDRGDAVATELYGESRFAATVVGDDVVVEDTLTGQLVERFRLSEEARAHGVRGEAVLHRAGRSVFEVVRPDPDDPDIGLARVVIVDGDGAVVGTTEGGLVRWLDHLAPDAETLPVRSGSAYNREHGTFGPPGPITFVALSTGRVVADSGTQDRTLADVVGDLAATMTVGDGFGRPGTGTQWRVVVRDTTLGEVVVDQTVTAARPPRLLGRLGGRVLLGLPQARTVTVVGQGDGGGLVPLAEATSSRVPGPSEPFIEDDSVLQSVVLTDDVLVLVDAGEEVLRAVGSSGRTVWTREVPGIEAIGADDGVVAVRRAGAPTLLLEAEDGATIATMPEFTLRERRELAFGVAPVVALDGMVAFGPQHGQWHGSPTPTQLTEGVWLDVRTGRVASAVDLLAPYSPEGVPPTALLYGTVADEAGRRTPVIVDEGGASTLRALLPSTGFEELELPDVGDDGPSSSHGYVAGAGAGTLVVSVEGVVQGSQEWSTTLALFDLATRTRTVIEDAYYVGMVGDLVLVLDAVALHAEDHLFAVPDDSPLVAAVDPATGERRWTTRDWGFGAAFVDDGTTGVIGDRFGLRATDLAAGTRSWSVASTTAMLDAMVVAGDTLVTRTTGTSLLAHGFADGALRWEAELGAIPTTMTAAGDHVVVGTHHGLVIHLDERGREVQRIAVDTRPITSVAVLGDTVVAVVDGRRAVGLRVDGDGITRRDEVDLP